MQEQRHCPVETVYGQLHCSVRARWSVIKCERCSVSVCMCMDMYMTMYVCIAMHASGCMYVCIYVFMYLCMYLYMYVFVFVCVCISYIQ